ncbi:MAG: hypothetical protein KJN93_05425 [Alphaproteobacteria bacterium]|nr:hypothetical protein [Alphaproteobacteria bacterium]
MHDLPYDPATRDRDTTATNKPRLRIALPAWRVAAKPDFNHPRGVDPAPFKSMMEEGLQPLDALHLRLTAKERKELSRSSRIRSAICGRRGTV